MKNFLILISSLFFLSSDAQTLVSVNPNSGNAGQTLDIIISGSNTRFSQGSPTVPYIQFLQGSSTSNVNSFVVMDDFTIKANITIPSKTLTGYYDVSTYGTDGYLFKPGAFFVNGKAAPSIKLNPNQGNAGQTLNITISGKNTSFTTGSGTSSYISFQQSSPTTAVNYTNIINDSVLVSNITIPPGTYTGNYTFSTYGDDGYLTGVFWVNGVQPPKLTNLTPASGSAGQSLTLTLSGSGTHFKQASGTQVNINIPGSTITGVNIISDSLIIFNITIPTLTFTGTYMVNLYNYIDGILYYSPGFYVNGLAKPKIKSLSPDQGKQGQTLDITISGGGSHFKMASSTYIYFGFLMGSSTLNSLSIINDSTILVNVTIPIFTIPDYYYVEVYNNIDGTMYGPYFKVLSWNSISDAKGSGFQVFPNPSTGLLFANFDLGIFRVINLLGEDFTDKVQQIDRRSIDIQNLPTGVYIISEEKKRWLQKFLKK